MTGRFDFVWLGDKKYCRVINEDGSREYRVAAQLGGSMSVRAVWRELPARCRFVRAKIDEALSTAK